MINHTHYANAYTKILTVFKNTNKLKKVSYSISDKRFCFAGRIENGILKVSLINIAIQPVKMRCTIDAQRENK